MSPTWPSWERPQPHWYSTLYWCNSMWHRLLILKWMYRYRRGVKFCLAADTLSCCAAIAPYSPVGASSLCLTEGWGPVSLACGFPFLCSLQGVVETWWAWLYRGRCHWGSWGRLESPWGWQNHFLQRYTATETHHQTTECDWQHSRSSSPVLAQCCFLTTAHNVKRFRPSGKF